MTPATEPAGALLRQWRQRRRLSQLQLACDAEVSQRHLSFMESGRALPSREMVLRLAQHLDVPLRERNHLLLAAGYAPLYAEQGLDDAALQAARRVAELVLQGHAPYPALAVDRHWHIVLANEAIGAWLEGVDAALLAPPMNALRISLHPRGLAPRIVNFTAWRGHILHRLRADHLRTADPFLAELADELASYPVPPGADDPNDEPGMAELGGIAVPLRLRHGQAVWSFISTTTVFGTPAAVTVAELAIESFFPADAATAAALGRG